MAYIVVSLCFGIKCECIKYVERIEMSRHQDVLVVHTVPSFLHHVPFSGVDVMKAMTLRAHLTLAAAEQAVEPIEEASWGVIARSLLAVL